MRYCSVLFIFIASLTACSSTGEKPAGNSANAGTATAAKAPLSSSLDNTGTTLLMSFVSSYYKLKNALVATKSGAADSASVQLAVAGGLFQHYLQSDTTHGATLAPYVDSILAAARSIPAIKDESCEKQRLAFGTISSAIYGLITHAGLKNAGIFHQYCPMAFNEKGAFWLSEENEIRNPYFGKKMLECGEVTDSL